MKVFVDTSAFYAGVCPQDIHHLAARKSLERLKDTGDLLATTNYVLLESASLIQRRESFQAAQTFLRETTRAFEVLWVDEPLHQQAISIWTQKSARDLSLVDCASFAAMKRLGIRQALAFDPHFARHGFEVIP